MGEAAETYLFQGVTRSRVFPLPLQCLWGKLQKHFLVKVSSEVAMSFRVAGMALCGIPFHTLHFTLCTPHSTLDALHSTLYTPHFIVAFGHFLLQRDLCFANCVWTSVSLSCV